MYWTLELASKLEDAPWPATKDELIDYAMRSGAPLEVLENLQEIEDEGDVYDSIEDIWPDYPSKDDFLWNEERILNNRKEFVSHWYKLFFVVGYALKRPRLLLQLRCICTLWRIYRRCNWPLFASNTCAIKREDLRC